MKTVRIAQIRHRLATKFIGALEYRQIIEELLHEVTAESVDVPKLKRDVMRFLKDGKKIAAIKLYRQETGVGLRDAKIFVESLQFSGHITESRMGRLAGQTVSRPLGQEKKKRLRHRPAPKSKKRKSGK